MKWIKTSERLPPIHKRVLIWTQDSVLLDWDRNFVHVYVMQRVPQQMYGNHVVPYSWSCENGGWEYSHNVTYWAEIEGPDEK